MYRKPRRGDVYFANMNGAAGSEQSGIRPVVIVQNDKDNHFSETTIVAMVTSKKKKATAVHVNLHSKDLFSKKSYVLTEQLSLTAIAQSMEVPYNEGVAWNKNMVKRIIENEKYLGTDKYPQLIDEDTFRRANAKRIAKTTSLCVISDELQQVRELTFCKECGHRLFRRGGNTRSEKWDCCRKECYPLDYRLTDQMLIGAILNVMNSVIANPSLLESSVESSTYAPSGEVIRQQNEIRHMMDGVQIDYERTKSEILRLAQMQYDCCTYSEKPQQTELLRNLLVGHEQLNSLDIGLLKSCQ